MTLDQRHLDALACPVCADTLSLEEKRVRCVQGHSFDVARQGHVQLSSRPIRHPGDTAEMIDARQRVQSAGLFDFLSDALNGAVANRGSDAGPHAPLVIDVGAGTGHHLAAVLEALPEACGVALDSSKVAGRRAARAHDRIASIVVDVTEGLALREGVVDVLLSVFAPRNPEAFARVVRPGGLVVVATPRPDHMAEPRAALGLLEVAEDKVEALAATLAPAFERVEVTALTERSELDAATLIDVVMMGPNAFHQDPEALAQAVGALHVPFAVTRSVDVSVFRRC